MKNSDFPNHFILWIEEQYEEYDPIFDDLKDLVGEEHVIVECTSTAGLYQLQHRVFDLLLLDVMLPRDEAERKRDLIHLDEGIRILRELRENNGWSTPPDCNVIVFTARGEKEALNAIKDLLGPHGHMIQKPAPVEIVLQKAREMLEGIEKHDKR